jgi:hypothetical protein
VMGVGVVLGMWLTGPHSSHASHGLPLRIMWARMAVWFTAGCFLRTAWEYEYGVNRTTAFGLGARGVVCADPQQYHLRAITLTHVPSTAEPRKIIRMRNNG